MQAAKNITTLAEARMADTSHDLYYTNDRVLVHGIRHTQLLAALYFKQVEPHVAEMRDAAQAMDTREFENDDQYVSWNPARAVVFVVIESRGGKSKFLVCFVQASWLSFLKFMCMLRRATSAHACF